jgi:short-subunit dehydrogenase
MNDVSSPSPSIGRSRMRLARLITEAFAEIGVQVECLPEDVRAAQGYYRNTKHFKIHRWEARVTVLENSSHLHFFKEFVLNSWHTMKECLDSGILIERLEDNNSYGWYASLLNH